MTTSSTEKETKWEKEFDEKFWANSNKYYVRGGREAVKQFIREAIAAQKEEILENLPKHCFGCNGKCTGIHYKEYVRNSDTKKI